MRTPSAVPLVRLLQETVRTPFRGLAALRQAAAVHPRGLTFRAEVVAIGPLPDGRYDAIARLTKGAGTPDGHTDVLGLAFRVRPEPDGGPWDVLLSSAGHGRYTRWLPIPSDDWGKADYTTLSPYERNGRQFWLRATPDAAVGHASVSKLRDRAPAAFTLSTAGTSGGWLTIGRLTLLEPLSDTGDRFDPILNSPPGWVLAPGWLRTIRELAYQGSRRGRGHAAATTEGAGGDTAPPADRRQEGRTESAES
jgi:hypothetical protein